MAKNVSEYEYLRPSSGLTKSIGLWGAILFGVHCISLSSSGLIPFSWVASNWAGASIKGLLFISMIVSLFHGYTFAAIGASVPRSGADYILASRFLNPTLAFMGSWILVIFSGIVLGGLLVFIPKTAIPALFQPMSIIFANENYAKIAEFSSSPSGCLVIGLAALLISLSLMFLPTKRILQIFSVGFILGILAWIFIYISLNSSDGPQTFQNAWNHFMSGSSQYGSYNARLALAKDAGMTLSGPYSMTLAGLIMGFWIFYGYFIPSFFAGEVKKTYGGWTIVIASGVSILVSGTIFIIAAYLLNRSVPDEWIAAEGYIANNPDAVTAVTGGTQVTGYPWITFYAAILKPNPWLIGFVAFAWIFTLINLAQTYFFYTSRIVFAWAFDRIIPQKFADVSKKTNVPIYALLGIGFFALIGVIDASLSGPLNTQLTFAFFAVLTQIVSVIALLILPYRNPDEFNLCPGFVRAKVAGIPLITIFGVLTLIYLLWMIVASFLYPAVGIGSPAKTLFWLLLLLVSGFLVFTISKRYRKREGIDLDQMYKTIPPA